MKWPPAGAPGPFPLDKLLTLNGNSLPITLEKGGYRALGWAFSLGHPLGKTGCRLKLH
jgi:hypothetical protein